MNDTNQRIIKSGYAAEESQRKRLEERKKAAPFVQTIFDKQIMVLPGVYGTGIDTSLMIETVHISSDQCFLEIGCGTGVISLFLASKCLHGTATDINPMAIENSRQNAKLLDVQNVEFIECDGFGALKDKYDILICNPPYNNHAASDLAERMFWDPENHLKQSFFLEAKKHLSPNGRIYFGWSDFSDIDTDLPFRLAEENGLVFQNKTVQPSENGKFNFMVLEFTASN